jgi:hypothetical protein
MRRATDLQVTGRATRPGAGARAARRAAPGLPWRLRT